jgi:autotransporter translocation and assembly factor TamB
MKGLFTQLFGAGGGGIQTMSINGTTVVINGQAYDKVTRVLLETVDKKRVAVPGEFSSLDIRVQGDCRSVETQSGSVTVEGSCEAAIKTMSGDVTLEQHCGGSVSTMSGSVNVGGKVKGSVSTMSGNIRHAVKQLVKKKEKKKPLQKEEVNEKKRPLEEEEEEAREKKRAKKS